MNMREFLPVFIDESKEHLQGFNEQLLRLEKDPTNKLIINEIFRSAHTLKGMAATMGFQDLTNLTHQLENMLDEIRNGRIMVNAEIIDGLFVAVNDLDIRIQSIIIGLNDENHVIDVKRNRMAAIEVENNEFLSLFLEREIDQIDTNPHTGNRKSKPTIRVKLESLDKIMNLFRNLTSGREKLERISMEFDHHELTEIVSQLNIVSSEIQNTLLRMRMLPISTVFYRFPGMVKGLARELGKQVSLEIIGENTEIEGFVVDEIGDTLLHIIRNALDHGIETPDSRTEAGKPVMGNVSLSAYNIDNSLVINVTDDGAGIDRQKILHSAVRKGLITERESIGLTDKEVFEFLFRSGFSTAAKISNISGRGVGLDVAKYTIESLGGTLSIDSQLGKGTVFLIKLPLMIQNRNEGDEYVVYKSNN